MPDQPKQGTAPFSLRLTPEERRSLEDRAGRQPLGVYIRERLFADEGGKSKRQRAARRPSVQNEQALAQVLALLGQSRLASNLNQLARATNSGALPVNPDTESALAAASADVAAIKAMVMQALGIRER